MYIYWQGARSLLSIVSQEANECLCITFRFWKQTRRNNLAAKTYKLRLMVTRMAEQLLASVHGLAFIGMEMSLCNGVHCIDKS